MDHTPTFHKRVIHRRLTYSSHIFSLGSYVSLRGSTLHTVYIYIFIDLLTRSIFMFLISAFLFLPNQRWKINLNDLICFSIFIFERPNKTRMIPSSWHCALPPFLALASQPGKYPGGWICKTGVLDELVKKLRLLQRPSIFQSRSFFRFEGFLYNFFWTTYNSDETKLNWIKVYQSKLPKPLQHFEFLGKKICTKNSLSICLWRPDPFHWLLVCLTSEPTKLTMLTVLYRRLGMQLLGSPGLCFQEFSDWWM